MGAVVYGLDEWGEALEKYYADAQLRSLKGKKFPPCADCLDDYLCISPRCSATGKSSLDRTSRGTVKCWRCERKGTLAEVGAERGPTAQRGER